MSRWVLNVSRREDSTTPWAACRFKCLSPVDILALGSCWEAHNSVQQEPLLWTLSQSAASPILLANTHQLVAHSGASPPCPCAAAGPTFLALPGAAGLVSTAGSLSVRVEGFKKQPPNPLLTLLKSLPCTPRVARACIDPGDGA